MKNYVLLILALGSLNGLAQIGGEAEIYLTGERIEAKFNGGGIDQFSEFIRQEFDYSKVTKAGKMVGAFTVDIDGSLKNIKIIQMMDVASATEFIRVLNKCHKWQPASRGGKPISIEITYPMNFNMNSSASKENTNGLQKPNEVKPGTIAATGSNSEDNEQVFNVAGVEAKPRYPGGMQAFYKFIASNYQVPNGITVSGKVFLKFVVEKDGSLADIVAIKDIGLGTGEEAIRVLKKCPNWIAGEQKGKKVRVLFTLPINITPR